MINLKNIKHKISSLLIFFTNFGKSVLDFYIKYLFLLQIKLVWFVGKTFIGYLLFVFCFFYGFFGWLPGEGQLSHLICMAFALFTISTTIELFILVKIPLSKKYLQRLLGEDFLVAHLGDHMMTSLVSRIGFFFVATSTVELATHGIEHFSNRANAQSLRDLAEECDNPEQKAIIYGQAADLYKKTSQGCISKVTTTALKTDVVLSMDESLSK